MNKKGFTLIELLSVIIILGIILAIAVPRIIDVINSSKKNSLESSAKLLSNNIKKDFEIKALTSNQDEQLYIIEDYEFTNESETIEYIGKLPKEGYIKVKDNGKIAYALSDGNNYVTKYYDSDEVKLKKLNKDISDIWTSVNREYVLATDNDFEWLVSNYGYNLPSKPQKGYYVYKGTDDYVEIPHTIEGNPITSYLFMFEGSNVSGVKSTNKNVTDMSDMFSYSEATSLDLSSFDTSNVTNMNSMFEESQATSLDLSNFDTSNVTYMSWMFYGSQATSLDLSSFDTSKVTDMCGMFSYSEATSLDLSNFDTSKVTDMSWMFAYSQATSLDLSNFNTSNVTYMNKMFYNSQATSLDLSSFDTSNVTSMGAMFEACQATTGYARTQADADNFNASSNKPAALNFIVK